MSLRLSLIAFTSLILSSLVLSAPSPPTLVYPLQLQRPPVARVNELWSWKLYPNTFTASSDSTISLSSQRLPTWATFDAASATFAGVPGSSDIGSTDVIIQANSSGIATGVTDDFVLVVVDAVGPFVRMSIASQIPSASNLGGGGTVVTPDGALRVPPGWSFSLGFQQYTFQTPNYDRIYYTAYETGLEVLPEWLNFDNETVTFGGVAPVMVGEFSITIFGSTIFGYGDVSQVFRLAVGYHSLELLSPLPALNTTRSDHVSYVIPLTSLRLDNSTITDVNLTSIAVDLTSYPYLTYDPATLTIKGTLSSTLQPLTGSIPIIFTDVYNDTVTTTLPFNVVSSLFTNATLPVLTVVAGTAFTDNLSTYASSKIASYSAIFSPSSVSQWLSFNPVTMTISGTPPAGIALAVTVQLSAFDSSDGVTSSASFAINVALPTPPASTTTSTSAQTSSTSSAADAAGGGGGLSQAAKLGIGISLGVVGGLIVLALLMSYCRQYVSEDGLGRAQRRDSSFLIFDQATITTAQNTKLNSQTTKATLAGIPTTMQEKKKQVIHTPPMQQSRSESIGEQQEKGDVIVKEASAKRFDLLGLLRGALPKKEMPIISLPISQNSLYGLGIGDTPPRSASSPRHATEEPRAPKVGPSSSARLADAESDLERSSSWESQGSSSWFYSEGSDSDGVMRRTRKPPSAPRQRRDFLPLPLRRLSPSVSRSYSHPAVRLVPSDSLPSNSDSTSDFDSRLFPPPMPPPHPLATGMSMHDIASNDESTLDSIVTEPRLIPFTQQRITTEPTSAEGLERQYPSQEAIRNNRDSEMMDADEMDESNLNRRSALYVAPTEPGSPVIAPIYFSTPSQYLSPNLSEYSERPVSHDERLIGSAVPTSSYIESRPLATRHQRTNTSSSYASSSREDGPAVIALLVGEPFRFTPRLNPAPSASIATPARAGPNRSTYFARVDRPGSPLNGSPLPPWCRFDENVLEIFGAPRSEDVGFLHIQIVERKVIPGSPKRGTNESEFEEVVGRYILEVSGDVTGVWEPITY